MAAPDPHRVLELFAETMRRPVAERAAYLDEACSGDTALRDAVESLAGPERLGETSRVRTAESDGEPDEWTVAPPEALSEAPGTVIGRYRLLQVIGEGGFGRVFMAEQTEPMVRRVALKIIKLGMDTRQVIARFEAERQALAMMDHPNIARVLDAGATASGRPYFVMELVRGEPITSFCRREGLTIRERMALVIQACRAVHHAHQRGIIHRDIKPGNILVAIQDGLPVAKVIDFGIAKATDHRLTERTLFTRFHQMIGTPEYMSPEQASGNPDVDARTDVYSLGVVLYELLAGRLPYDVTEATLPQVAEVVRRRAPARPSRCDRRLRGDLDVILLTALHKDRERRYSAAVDLAEDLERVLSSRPITARRDSVAYVLATRSRAAAKRHPIGATLLAVAAAVALAYWPATPLVFTWTPLGAWFEHAAFELAPPPASTSLEHVRVMAMTDETDVEGLSEHLGLPPVDPAVKWAFRALHGRLMEQLARTGVRAVVWDIHFPEERPEVDPAFVRGIRALRESGKGVVIGLPEWPLDGAPHDSQISPQIVGEAEVVSRPPLPTVHLGTATLLPDGTVPWKLDVIAQRGDLAEPSLVLAGFAAARNPRYGADYVLDEKLGQVVVRYWDPVRRDPRATDRIRVSTVGPAGKFESNSELGLLPNDVVGNFVLRIPGDDVLGPATIRYEDVLVLDVLSPDERRRLEADLNGTVVVVANFRGNGDVARYPDGRTIQKAYAHAVGLETLLSGALILLPRPVHIFVLLTAGAVLGVGIPWMVQRWMGLRRAVLVVAVALIIAGGFLAFRYFDYLCNPAVPLVSLLVAAALGTRIVRAHQSGAA